MDQKERDAVLAVMRTNAKNVDHTAFDQSEVLATKFQHDNFVYTSITKNGQDPLESIVKWDLKVLIEFLAADRSNGLGTAYIPATTELTDEDWQKLHDELVVARS